MDLSQQELPLTTHFPRATRPRLVSREGDGASKSKRKRSDGRRSPVSSPAGSVRQSRLRPTTLQLPTPATSARKRLRAGDPKEPLGKAQLTSSGALSSVDRGAIPSRKRDVAQLEFAPTPSKPLRSSRQSAEDATPRLHDIPILVRKETEPIDLELVSDARTGIVTPQTSSRRAPEPVDRMDDSPLPHCPLPSEPENTTSVPWDRTLVLSKTMDRRYSNGHVMSVASVQSSQSQYLIHPDATPKRTRYFQPTGHLSSSNGHVTPMIPIQSSQSQYLLHPDATPKRRRYSRPIEHVISSQTQEEGELTSPPGKHQSQRTHTRGSSVAPVSASTGPARFTEKKPLDELPFESFGPSRRKRSPFHSPSRKTRTPRGPSRRDSIENVPPGRIEDSVTESESDLDIFQVPRHSTVSRDGFLPAQRGTAQRDLAGTEDDSATEAESDTDILHCLAEIGKKRSCERRSAAPSGDAPPPRIVSPLVSPARSRITAKHPVIGSTRLPVAEGGGSRSRATSTVEHHSDSLPSAVREFIRMFPGDESYPPDFPESLRI